MPHIEVQDVSLVYDTPAGQVPGVQAVSFNIEQSEFLCLVGPSGCGKSTLLNIIAGFLAPTAGQIRIGGKAVTGHGMDRGVVFQDFAQLFPWRTALGNVAFGLEMKGVPKQEREEMQALLDLAKSKERAVGAIRSLKDLDGVGDADIARITEGIRSRLDQADARAEIETSRLEDQVDATLGKAELDLQLAERKKRLGLSS